MKLKSPFLSGLQFQGSIRFAGESHFQLKEETFIGGSVNLNEIRSDCFQRNFIFQPVNFKMEYK